MVNLQIKLCIIGNFRFNSDLNIQQNSKLWYIKLNGKKCKTQNNGERNYRLLKKWSSNTTNF